MIEFKREQYMVEAYHYDLRNPEAKDLETKINVNLTPMKPAEEMNYPETDSILGARLSFMLVFDNYTISGSVAQVTHAINRKVTQQADLDNDELEELISPLFDVVKRITYEVTEIALDRPGITLNFESNFKTQQN